MASMLHHPLWLHLYRGLLGSECTALPRDSGFIPVTCFGQKYVRSSNSVPAPSLGIKELYTLPLSFLCLCHCHEEHMPSFLSDHRKGRREMLRMSPADLGVQQSCPNCHSLEREPPAKPTLYPADP